MEDFKIFHGISFYPRISIYRYTMILRNCKSLKFEEKIPDHFKI